jgi:hypothetical protein
MFEIRQVWKGKPGEKMEHPFAKATYVKSKAVWAVLYKTFKFVAALWASTGRRAAAPLN